MRVRVTRTVTLPVTETATVHYEAGQVRLAPRAHILRIEAADAGKRLTAREEKAFKAAAAAAKAEVSPEVST